MQQETILMHLFNGKYLTQTEMHYLFQQIMLGKLSNEQLAGALIALKVRGETPNEIVGAVKATLEHAEPFSSPDYPFVDIVGTGGDGENTINISTASAIVACAMGVKVAKHGSRGVSSPTGASDVLVALGVNVAMNAQMARQALDELGLCFLFAPQYHLGFKHAMPVRQALKTRTIFNILGPLVNPARPKHQLLGVYTPTLIQSYAETVQQLQHQHSIVVHGAGLDEIAIHGETKVAEIWQDKIDYFTLTPEDFGVKRHSLEALRGGTPEQNAQKLLALFQGKGDEAHIDAVAVNVAMALRLLGNHNLKQNVENVKNVLNTAESFAILQKFRQYNQPMVN